MMLIGPGGQPQICSCPEVKGDVIEPTVWNTIAKLIKDPDLLMKELHHRNDTNSQTKESAERELQLCEKRLKVILEEQKRLVEGYRKGLYADFMMREDMEVIQKEQAEIEKRKSELVRQLSQRNISENQEVQIRRLMEDISKGLQHLDFPGRQELLRLLIDKVTYSGQGVEILTIIPPREQLHPIQRRGQRG